MKSTDATRLSVERVRGIGIGITAALGLLAMLAPTPVLAQQEAPVGSLEEIGATQPATTEPAEAATAEDTGEPPPLDSSEPPVAECEAPEDAAVTRDWVRLTSGEWLSGGIDRIRDRVLYIDSEELDDIEVDLDDVAAIRSTRTHTLRFEGRKIYTGTVSLDGDQLTIVTANGPRTLEKAKLVAMVPGEPREKNYWSGDASVGFTLRQGNTEQAVAE